MSDRTNDSVWVFVGNNATLPGAIFTTRDKAEEWIRKHAVQGVLTEYPLDTSVYDYAIEQGWFTPNKDYQSEPKFIQRFTSASMQHFHFDAETNEH